MKVIVSGGTGFVGRSLADGLLHAGHEVVLLTRHTRVPEVKSYPALLVERWDGRTLGDWTKTLEGADAVVNLCGENIALKRWTSGRKRQILNSRLTPTRILVEAMRQAKVRPRAFINASAVGFYGHTGDNRVTESSAKGKGFLSETCDTWESEARKAEELGIRTVLLRLGVVIEKGGGALAKMYPAFKFFLGGPLGSGKQLLSWVHLQDAVGIILFLLNRRDLSGPVNATTPNPISMKQFSDALGSVIKRPSWFKVPSLFLKILLGEMSQLLLISQNVYPEKLVQAGYRYRYPKIEQALQAIFR